jgi:hypothetical protein
LSGDVHVIDGRYALYAHGESSLLTPVLRRSIDHDHHWEEISGRLPVQSRVTSVAETSLGPYPLFAVAGVTLYVAESDTGAFTARLTAGKQGFVASDPDRADDLWVAGERARRGLLRRPERSRPAVAGGTQTRSSVLMDDGMVRLSATPSSRSETAISPTVNSPGTRATPFSTASCAPIPPAIQS